MIILITVETTATIRMITTTIMKKTTIIMTTATRITQKDLTARRILQKAP